MEKIYSVRELNLLIYRSFQFPKFKHLMIEGEVSNLKLHQSGYYFLLKDDSGSIPCVILSNAITEIKLKDGDQLLVKGSIDYYVASGRVQLKIIKYTLQGIGQLLIQYENLKAKLVREGYFSGDHKKALPKYSFNIGIITSPQAAALKDALKVMQIKCPIVNVQLYPTLVQGKTAPKMIIEQLKKADTKQHDCLLLIRGGGSIEDLWCFNDEELVKTIYHLETPIICGVGHEHDVTLVDYVCDKRASTPTAAASDAVFDLYALQVELDQYKDRLLKNIETVKQKNLEQFNYLRNHPFLIDSSNLGRKLKTNLVQQEKRFVLAHQRFNQLKKQLILQQEQLKQRILFKVANHKARLLNENKQLNSFIEKNLKFYHTKLQKQCALLDALSPLKVLSKGYSIATKHNKVITSIQQVKVDDRLKIQLRDGEIDTVVKEVKDETKKI